MSRPFPARMMSAPPPARMTSLPPRPQMTSRPLVPVRMSLPAVPVIVQAPGGGGGGGGGVAAVTMVVALAVLLVLSGSSWLGPTSAVFLTVPAAVALTTIVTVADAFSGSVPIEQVTGLFPLHVPRVVVAET